MSRSQERLKAILTAENRDPKKSLGQNFLISDGVIEKVIRAAESFEVQHLLEIGPGPGSLTFDLIERLKPREQSFRVVELDRGWAEFWRQKGLSVIEADALKIPWKDFIHEKTILVSNLPYQISSTLVIDRSLEEKGLSGMVLMFQKEVAQKIRGTPKSELYGFLSVIAQSFWKIETVAEAGPRDFWPPPKVASRVLKFVPQPIEDAPRDREAYLEFVKMAFQQRRKTLRANWEGYLNRRPEGWSRVLTQIKGWGFSEKLRAEELAPLQFQLLFSIWNRKDRV
ncbi:MAG: 16S rRNA (adenine(1518)-N(6)/adenine(1519)-N(6))-dimethyltransferase RsmA [Bdellovibrionales bacterium]